MERKTDFKSMTRNLRKQMVIETAINLFHQKGYRTATLDDVAHELGLSKAALYHYVSSKEDLLSLIYLQALESYFTSAYQIDEMNLEPPEKLRHLIQHHIQKIIIDNLPMFAVFVTEENQLPRKQFEKIQEGKRKYTNIFEKIIQEGMEKGFFRRADAQLQASAILGMCNWLYKWYKPAKTPYETSEIADHLVDLLERGYLEQDVFKKGSDYRLKSGLRRKEESGRNRKLYSKLKSRCAALMEVVEEMREGS